MIGKRFSHPYFARAVSGRPETHNVKRFSPFLNVMFQGQFTDKMLSDVLGLADIQLRLIQLRVRCKLNQLYERCALLL